MGNARKVLDWDSLQSNGITFDRKVIGLSEIYERLGEQAETLAARLLDFHKFAPQERAKPLLASKDRSLRRRLNADIEDPRELRKLKRELTTKAVRAHRHAMKIVTASETRWIELVKSELFKDMLDRARDTEGASTIGVKELAKSLRVEGEDTWSVAHSVRSETAPFDALALTRPKPDLYISLPTVEEHKVPRGFAGDPSMGNFRTARLQFLEHEKGLLSNPRSRISGKKLKEKDRLCFPCVVLEAKHHEVRQAVIKKCYCQAANGTACALALLNGLTSEYTAADFKREIRPVVAITLNGHKTRVWIAGIKSRKQASEMIPTDRGSELREFTRVRYHMQCIWKGDLQFEEPMMQLICIIDALEKWIINDFRPWVSGYLGRHYSEGESDEETEVCSSDEEEAENDLEDRDSEGSEEYEDTDEEENYDTDEEEREWDENWIGSECESESGPDSDDEEPAEYLPDFNRMDSLLERLSLNDSFKSARRASHRFR